MLGSFGIDIVVVIDSDVDTSIVIGFPNGIDLGIGVNIQC